MADKGLIAAIVQFLTQQLKANNITVDSRESLEVAIQCLESAYNIQASDTPTNFNLQEVYTSIVKNGKPQSAGQTAPEATPEAKAAAERLKNEGNALMKAEKHQEALASYTKAIQLDGRNAVYYCNRAAVYSKIGCHQQAIQDCQTALSIDPTYCKAYGRLGLAYSSLEKHKEARDSYEKALEMEPDNESYKNNLNVAEEKLAQQNSNRIGLDLPLDMDFSALLNNTAIMNMAQQMLSDPVMQNTVSNFVSGNAGQRQRMQVLLETGLQLAQQMRNANPETIESIRQQMGGNPNDPEPPQQN
ncbi:small glutamine-rich tetratricopeptide repeat-containing protein alpha-like [Hylaeus volcanicus]|uniref:small glutamine-rich tetratricopeptide repeat-containing protein alpha-like n=1 Tax=Hylaeus volcanicus TaxID=313075 RepID=UPI0023B80B63|nr:small glutamine-rich tetratricopeptide repeat-containing protein alpha-like [Hylaeus volcanicus]XP_053985039.1 small glutamine-rich tetratricopeptide repeat-containing protein alpha-like [Hylaeus volcanicus]XP_053985048.1 small glutamine-rich tetratricopeptide repeat-containing protein alpha-like [Hylaeus volcanicus]